MMHTAVDFLRGINVSGQKLIKMEALQAVCKDIGLKEDRTYIQSGNVVFKTKSLTGLGKKISGAIKKEFGFEVPVVVKSHPEIMEIIKANPFAGKPGTDIARCYVTMFSSEPDFSQLRVNIPESGKDEFRIAAGSVYLYSPERYGDTKLSNAFFEKRLACVATTRNWRTMTTILEWCDKANV